MTKWISTLFICSLSWVLGGETDSDIQDWTDPTKTKCEIHGTLLTKVVARIQWGDLARPKQGYSRGEQQKLFPYSFRVALGGCIVPVGFEKMKRARIFRCSACDLGFERWLAENYPLPDRHKPIAPEHIELRHTILESTKMPNKAEMATPRKPSD